MFQIPAYDPVQSPSSDSVSYWQRWSSRFERLGFGDKWRRFMTDYHTVMAQAVESLDQNTSRTRRALYERARAAQVTHLRAIHPPLSESAIAKERLSLESAIREVEADIAGKSETGLRESKPDVALPHTATASFYSERSERAMLERIPVI